MKIYRMGQLQRDSDGEKIGIRENYILKLKWEKIKDPDKPYFLGGGSFQAPEMVMLPSEAAIVSGYDLANMAYPWSRDWTAIRMRNYNANQKIEEEREKCPDCNDGKRTVNVMRDQRGNLDFLHGKLTGETMEVECERCEGTGFLG